ncbi:response regulator [Clostridium chromiireducens]|uniref:Stage 0 sporulation protein A homolog n=1 Tax=Clostridium chromiireducens TaxID=225345 RepID=A0A1V4IQC3_9CLOT|nr:response regulator [Clostridium chromiireducens]MVX65981.1 response regulator [Clostridium chromiireducens]OPJ62218.1 putative response regulatory protein [Clostridium chromiireducens]RII35785.1 response regulator [Clostridium chromiireducens]
MYKAIVVDDEEMIRKGICKVIPWEKLKIDTIKMASSGIEALRIMEEESFDIMITDICMSEMDGLSLVEKINCLNPRLKVIVLTGYDNFEYAKKCCKMQVEDYLLKPVDEVELEDTIKRLIGELDNEKIMNHQQKINNRIQGITEQLKIEQIMQNLLYERVKADEIKRVLDEYSYSGEQMLQIALVCPVIDDNLSWRQHFELLNLYIKNTCIELFDSIKEGVTFEDKNKNIAIAIFIREDLEEITLRIKRLIDYLKNEYDINPKVILGSAVEGFNKINISYNDACTLLNNKSTYGGIITKEPRELRLTLFNERVQEFRKNIIDNIDDIEKVMSIYASYEDAIEFYNLSTQLVKKTCFDIGGGVYFSYMMEKGLVSDNKLNSLLISLQNCERNDAIRITRDFIMQILQADIGESHEIIGKAKLYIKDHLNEDISVYSIAEMLYLTPTYFSKLFKQSTGEGCNNYIIRKRIQRAKSLLETTSMKTGKIATLVGYNDTNYFSLAFKKQTGMSPTEFREKAGRYY